MSEKGFFALSISLLHDIIEAGGDCSDLMAYLILAKHTTGRGKHAYMLSTAGAKAISKRTGLTYRKAQISLEWLKEKCFIRNGNHLGGIRIATRANPGGNPSKATEIRWTLPELGEDRVYLAHSLTEGIGAGKKRPPLIRLWNHVKLGTCDKVMDSRTDALLLLMHCYAQQSIEDFGGISPILLRYDWTETENLEGLDDIELDVMEVKRNRFEVAKDFQEEVLTHVPQEQRHSRFLSAFECLKTLGLLYEVLEVWQGNPIVDPRSELFYPLYVLDYHARKNEPYVQQEIHTFLRKADYLDDYGFKWILDEGMEKQSFRLLKTRGGNECVVGTYRLRFRPNTEDSAEGMEQEWARHKRLRDILSHAMPTQDERSYKTSYMY